MPGVAQVEERPSDRLSRRSLGSYFYSFYSFYCLQPLESRNYPAGLYLLGPQQLAVEEERSHHSHHIHPHSIPHHHSRHHSPRTCDRSSRHGAETSSTARPISSTHLFFPTKRKRMKAQSGESPPSLLCLRASATLRYSNDHRTARCRLSHSIFTQHQIRINSIIHFKIHLSESFQFSVLCLALPYVDSEYDTDEVVLDDSVVKGERVDWSSGTCEVLPPSLFDFDLS
jgi:hypothetical protein